MSEESVLPTFSSKSFIVSGLIFRSLIHLSVFLCMVLEGVLDSFFYTWFSQHHLLKRLYLQVCILNDLFCFSKLGTKIRSSQGVVEP